MCSVHPHRWGSHPTMSTSPSKALTAVACRSDRTIKVPCHTYPRLNEPLKTSNTTAGRAKNTQKGAALAEDQDSISSSQPSVTSVPGDPVSLSGLLRHCEHEVHRLHTSKHLTLSEIKESFKEHPQNNSNKNNEYLSVFTMYYIWF